MDATDELSEIIRVHIEAEIDQNRGKASVPGAVHINLNRELSTDSGFNAGDSTSSEHSAKRLMNEIENEADSEIADMTAANPGLTNDEIVSDIRWDIRWSVGKFKSACSLCIRSGEMALGSGSSHRERA